MIAMKVLRAGAVLAGLIGGLSSAAYGLLNEQSRRTRRLIGRSTAPPLNADGRYRPDGTGPYHADGAPDRLRFAVLGDSSAAGLGVETTAQLPGVLLARGLAERSGRPVDLVTYAVRGATTRSMIDQVDRALDDPPDLTLILVGPNDVTDRLSVRASAETLGEQVRRLRATGAIVVVGTCADLGSVRSIPQPLRHIAHTWSLLLARAQYRAVTRADGIAVPLADLLSPQFVARPSEMFSTDHYHPSAAGYEAAAALLLAPLCQAVAGRPALTSPPPIPSRPRIHPRVVEAGRAMAHVLAWPSGFGGWRQRTIT